MKIRASEIRVNQIRVNQGLGVFQKAILSLKFKFPANNSKVFLAGNLNFELRIVFWNMFFWRFEKLIANSEKNPPV